MKLLKVIAFSLLAISFLFPFENAFAQKGSVKDKLVDAPYTAVE